MARVAWRAFLEMCFVAVAAGCAGDPGDAGDAADLRDMSDASDVVDAPLMPVSCSVDGSKAPSVPTPLLVGGFARVFAPEGTRYLNDHTLVRAPDGRWHVFGITHTSMGNPQAERSFLHATASSLMGP